MRTIAFAVVLMSVVLFAPFDRPAQAGNSGWFMAFCNDGDGPLSDWVNTRNEAYLAGRDHLKVAGTHRWEVLVQQGETLIRPAACALITDGEKPDTVRLVNTCGSCRKFTVSRTFSDGNVKSKQFTVKPGSNRFFRKIEGAVIKVEGEADCPN
jgi:hypothetical protein